MEINEINTITKLSQLDGRVYVYLPTASLAAEFLQQAESEGFLFGDGVKPTQREAAYVMAINPDHTIHYVGAVGRMAFGAGAQTVGGQKLYRVTYTGNSGNHPDRPFSRYQHERSSIEQYKQAILWHLMDSDWHYSEESAQWLIAMRENYILEAFSEKESAYDAAMEVGFVGGAGTR